MRSRQRARDDGARAARAAHASRDQRDRASSCTRTSGARRSPPTPSQAIAETAPRLRLARGRPRDRPARRPRRFRRDGARRARGRRGGARRQQQRGGGPARARVPSRRQRRCSSRAGSSSRSAAGFRIPEVLARSGARMVEVGTTNKTRERDYAEALDAHGDVAAILRVHPGNFRQTGFVERPSLEALVALARPRGVAVLEDLGGGLARRPRRRGARARAACRRERRRGGRPRVLQHRQGARRTAGRRRRRPRGARREDCGAIRWRARCAWAGCPSSRSRRRSRTCSAASSTRSRRSRRCAAPCDGCASARQRWARGSPRGRGVPCVVVARSRRRGRRVRGGGRRVGRRRAEGDAEAMARRLRTGDPPVRRAHREATARSSTRARCCRGRTRI